MSKPNTVGLGEYKDEDLIEELRARGKLEQLLAQRGLEDRDNENRLWKPVAEEIASKYGVYMAVNHLNKRVLVLNELQSSQQGAMNNATYDERVDKLFDDCGHDAVNGMTRLELRGKYKAELRTLFKEMCEEVMKAIPEPICSESSNVAKNSYEVGWNDYRQSAIQKTHTKLATILEGSKG